MINNYNILKILGEGAFGKVKLATKILKDFDHFEKKYAIKIYKKANLRKKKTLIRDKNGSLYNNFGNFYFMMIRNIIQGCFAGGCKRNRCNEEIGPSECY